MKTISSLACSASIAACLATSHAFADNQQDAALLKLLQEKGIISAKEAQSLQAEQARRAQQQATVSMGSKGLKIESADKPAYKLAVACTPTTPHTTTKRSPTKEMQLTAHKSAALVSTLKAN